MKLECKIRRQGGTHVELLIDDTLHPYHFKPLDPTLADSPHVVEVSDMTHFARFITLDASVYVPFEGKAPKVDLPKPSATAAQLAAAAMSAVDLTATTKPDANAEKLVVVEQADGTQALKFEDQPSWAALQSGIKAGTFSQEQLREWMAAEEASDTPRPGYIAAIVKALT